MIARLDAAWLRNLKKPDPPIPAVYHRRFVRVPTGDLAGVLLRRLDTRLAWLAATAAVAEALRNGRSSPFEGAEDHTHGSKEVAAILAAQDARDRAETAMERADADARAALAAVRPGPTPWLYLAEHDTYLRLDWSPYGLGAESWVIDTPEARAERAGRSPR